jgi:hypothetical protein
MLSTLAFLPFLVSSITTPKAGVIPVANAMENNLDAPFFINTESAVLLDVPYVHQKEDLENTQDAWAGGSACGPASLTMALNFNDEDFDLIDVVNSLPSNVYVKGSMFYNLTKGPEEFGYKANEISISTKEIFETLKLGHPILMNIQNYDGITGHEIVVVGIKGYDENTKTADSLIVHDPFGSAYREFEYINETTLRQPEGYFLPIGTLKPFYITKSS